MSSIRYEIGEGIVDLPSVRVASRQGWSLALPGVRSPSCVYAVRDGARRLVGVVSSPSHVSSVVSASRTDRVVRVDDLVLLSDVARSEGVDASTPEQWVKRYPDFPRPLKKIGRQNLYDYAEICEWLETNRPYGRVVRNLPRS